MTAIWSSYDGGQDYSSGTKEDQADLKEPLTEFAPGCTIIRWFGSSVCAKR